MHKEHLAYVSRAAPDLDNEAIERILDVAQRNNPALSVTGYLLCNDGYFCQILEGPGASLNILLPRIKADTRHGDLKLLYREVLPRRNFANWSMGLCTEISPRISAETKAHVRFLHQLGRASPAQMLALFYRTVQAGNA